MDVTIRVRVSKDCTMHQRAHLYWAHINLFLLSWFCNSISSSTTICL
jgi:hypothetical protein